ncbi:hypothetical protein F5Y11DRAFT_312941 [Daldinia sp. FL1419]|nr:hypothetical protein F5Y11DRAFT_312941 [Daldinia sp. FL1419]
MEDKRGSHPPFALFILSDKITVEYINKLLQRVADDNYGVFCLTLVQTTDPSDPYDCAPDEVRIVEDGRESIISTDGTRPPIPDSFVSPFIGKSLEECAEFLRRTPDKKDWNREHFCVLGDDDVRDDTVTLVRGLDNGRVHAYPETVELTGSSMFTMWTGNSFEEKLQMYQAGVEEHPEKDRSVGKAFEYVKYDDEES